MIKILHTARRAAGMAGVIQRTATGQLGPVTVAARRATGPSSATARSNGTAAGIDRCAGASR